MSRNELQDSSQRSHVRSKKVEATADSLPQLMLPRRREERDPYSRGEAHGWRDAWGLGSVQSISRPSFPRLLHPRCSASACYLQNLCMIWMRLPVFRPQVRFGNLDLLGRRDVHVTLVPMPGIEAKTTQDTLVIIIDDLGERKQAELTLKRYTAYLEPMADLRGGSHGRAQDHGSGWSRGSDTSTHSNMKQALP